MKNVGGVVGVGTREGNDQETLEGITRAVRQDSRGAWKVDRSLSGSTSRHKQAVGRGESG